MAEEFSNSNIEAEIQELSQRIAEKRRQLESGKGIVEERDLVKSALGEKISSSAPQSAVVAAITAGTPVKPTTGGTSATSGKSYLDFLDDESRAVVESLVEEVFAKGLEKTLKDLTIQEPYIIDVFHDVLTDKIYDELKKRGIL